MSGAAVTRDPCKFPGCVALRADDNIYCPAHRPEAVVANVKRAVRLGLAEYVEAHPRFTPVLDKLLESLDNTV